MLGETPLAAPGSGTPANDPIRWTVVPFAGAGLAAAGPDRHLPPVDLPAVGPPLPLHPQLQRLWPRGDRPPWGGPGQLADPLAAAALPSLDALWLRPGARLMVEF